MVEKNYTVSRIEGEYAYLKDLESGVEIFIALALLPEGSDEGSHLHYENFEYTLID